MKSRSVIGALLLLIATCIVGSSAIVDGLAGRVDWSYWQTAVAGGPEWDRSDLGYLPGFPWLLRPFVLLPRPYGNITYVLVALLLAAGTIAALRREILRGSTTPVRSTIPCMLWLSGAFLVAIRNNQVTVQMMAVLTIGLILLVRGRTLSGAAVIGLSALLKPITLGMSLYFVFRREWKPALVIGAAPLLASLLLVSLGIGPAASMRKHVDWPLRILALQSTDVEAADSPAGTARRANQGPMGVITEAGLRFDSQSALLLGGGLFFFSILATAAIANGGRTPSEHRWENLALWLACVTVAAPFGRYYYSVLLVPAWMVVVRNLDGTRCPRALRHAAIAVPALAWGGRTEGLYAATSLVTFLTVGLMLLHARSGNAEPRTTPAPGLLRRGPRVESLVAVARSGFDVQDP